MLDWLNFKSVKWGNLFKVALQLASCVNNSFYYWILITNSNIGTNQRSLTRCMQFRQLYWQWQKCSSVMNLWSEERNITPKHECFLCFCFFNCWLICWCVNLCTFVLQVLVGLNRSADCVAALDLLSSSVSQMEGGEITKNEQGVLHARSAQCSDTWPNFVTQG